MKGQQGMKNDRTYSDLPGLHRTSLTEEAAMTIRRAILSGKFTHGQQLTESRISEGFHISRAPVREALQQLMSQGLVVHHPNRGYFLKKFSARDIEDMSLMRIAIEKFAVQLAIERASDEEIDALGKIVGEMEAFSETAPHDDMAAYEADHRFHDWLCQIAHHDMLRTIWKMMHDQIAVALNSLVNAYEWPGDAAFAHSHREIVNALRSRDIVAAQKAIEKHIADGVAAFREHPNRIAEE